LEQYKPFFEQPTGSIRQEK